MVWVPSTEGDLKHAIFNPLNREWLGSRPSNSLGEQYCHRPCLPDCFLDSFCLVGFSNTLQYDRRMYTCLVPSCSYFWGFCNFVVWPAGLSS